MKIVHYIPSLDRFSGGTATYIQILGEKLGMFSELHIVSHPSLHPVEIKQCQLHYIHTNIFGRMRHEWLDILEKVRPDIVHVNCCWLPSCALVQKWAQRAGYKVLITPHGMLEPWIISRHYWTRKAPALLLYQKKAVMKADCLHATAESEKANLLRLGYNKKIEVIANGIDVDKIVPKTSWKRNKEILFLSRIHVKKGINFLIEAVAALKQELKEYRINIAGEGDSNYINELKQTTFRLGVSENIHFIGGVYGNKKWELFRRADLFVLPTHSENFGMVVAEALACGTPVMTTKGTPWGELETECCGWWTEIGTEPTINALKEFLQLDESALKRMGTNGRRLAEEKYSSQKMAENMLALYQKIKENGSDKT